jgi:exonuclease III
VVGSHNIAGGFQAGNSDVEVIRAAVAMLCDIWRKAGLDVILVQECFVGHEDDRSVKQRVIEEALAACGYLAYFAVPRRRTRGRQARSCGGTAILVRQALLDEDRAKLEDVERGPDDRCLSATLSWGGHRIRLGSHYLPVGVDKDGQSAKTQYITERLAPEAAAAVQTKSSVLWGGDFNFVLNRDLDTLHSRGGALPRPYDDSVIHCWQDRVRQTHQMVDTFRAKRPTSRTISRPDKGGGGARLDRIHASPALAQWVTQASILPRTTSDHRMVTVHLQAKPEAAADVQLGRKRFRLRIDYADDPQLYKAFDLWLVELFKTVPEPEHHAAIVAWYEATWPKIVTKIMELNRVHRTASTAALAAKLPADILDDLAEREEAGELVAKDQVAAQRSFRAASLADQSAARKADWRTSWLHRGEQPSPAFTKMLRPPSASNAMPAVRDPVSQQLLTDPKKMAETVIKYSATISARRPEEELEAARLATRDVHQAMEDCGVRARMTGASIAALRIGATHVTEKQVKAAIRLSKSGTSPGPDGIPLAVYRKHRAVFAPVLSKVFTAMLAGGRLPAGFHDGIVTYIYKKAGDRTLPANYRPITLLNTSYRLFAKVLVDVLSPVMGRIIDPGQTAFIRGRRIGDTILHMQTAQALLGTRHYWAVAVFADFRKAYDTIDREFLFSTMTAMGVPQEFVKAARMMLTDTKASAYINGHTSLLEVFEEGIRQGCPLAPLLYLFVAEALLCMMRHTGVGISFPPQPEAPEPWIGCHPGSGVPGCESIIAPQFADDVKPLILGGYYREAETEAQLDGVTQRLAALRAALETFGLASGQKLNPDKTELLLIGCLPPNLRRLAPAGSTLAGFRIVDHATSLGVLFERGDGGKQCLANVGVSPICGAWSPKEAQLEAQLGRLEATMARLGAQRSLSIFGRGIGSGAYGVSQILYTLEFRGLPPRSVVERLTKAVSIACADRPFALGDGRPFWAVSGSLLQGRLADGGAGALAWLEHVRARHAMWAVRAVQAREGRPWVGLFHLLLLHLRHAPGLHPLGLFDLTGATAGPEMAPATAGTLTSLKRVGEIAWAQPRQMIPELVTRLLGGARALGPVCMLRHPAREGVPAAADDRPQHLIADELTTELGWRVTALKGDGTTNIHLVKPVVAAKATCPCLPPQPPRGQDKPRRAASSGCQAISVAAGTRIQLHRAQMLNPLADHGRWQRWAQFVEVVDGRFMDGERLVGQPRGERPLVTDAARAVAARRRVAPLFRLVSGLHTTNKVREMFFRLVYNGFKTAARLHVDRGCPCGSQYIPGRPHTFWDCPVAYAVRDEVMHSLPAGCVLERHHVWLLDPPHKSIHPQLWALISLAALAAMEKGRRTLAHLTLEAAAKAREAVAAEDDIVSPPRSPFHEGVVPDSDSDASSPFNPLPDSAPGSRSDSGGEDPEVRGGQGQARGPARLPRGRSGALSLVWLARRTAVNVFYEALAEAAELNSAFSGRPKFSLTQEVEHPLLRPTPVAGPVADRPVWSLRVVAPPGQRLPLSRREVAFDRLAVGASAREILLARREDAGRPGPPLQFCAGCRTFQLAGPVPCCAVGPAVVAAPGTTWLASAQARGLGRR